METMAEGQYTSCHHECSGKNEAINTFYTIVTEQLSSATEQLSLLPENEFAIRRKYLEDIYQESLCYFFESLDRVKEEDDYKKCFGATVCALLKASIGAFRASVNILLNEAITTTYNEASAIGTWMKAYFKAPSPVMESLQVIETGLHKSVNAILYNFNGKEYCPPSTHPKSETCSDAPCPCDKDASGYDIDADIKKTVIGSQCKNKCESPKESSESKEAPCASSTWWDKKEPMPTIDSLKPSKKKHSKFLKTIGEKHHKDRSFTTYFDLDKGAKHKQRTRREW